MTPPLIDAAIGPRNGGLVALHTANLQRNQRTRFAKNYRKNFWGLMMVAIPLWTDPACPGTGPERTDRTAPGDCSRGRPPPTYEGFSTVVSNRRTIIRRTAAALGAAALLTGLATPAAGANPLEGLGDTGSAAVPAFPNIPGLAPQGPAVDAEVPAGYFDKIRDMLADPAMPEDIKSSLSEGLGSITGSAGSSGGDAAEGEEEGLIPKDGPKINQFGPMLSPVCIGGETPSLGLATSVPGPAALPLPGIPAGQAGFVFTAMGTKGLADKQDAQMRVHWINPLKGKYGTTVLDRHDLNPDGPSTVWGVGDTGSGLVFAVIEGGVTADEESGPATCHYSPSVAIVPVK